MICVPEVALGGCQGTFQSSALRCRGVCPRWGNRDVISITEATAIRNRDNHANMLHYKTQHVDLCMPLCRPHEVNLRVTSWQGLPCQQAVLIRILLAFPLQGSLASSSSRMPQCIADRTVTAATAILSSILTWFAVRACKTKPATATTVMCLLLLLLLAFKVAVHTCPRCRRTCLEAGVCPISSSYHRRGRDAAAALATVCMNKAHALVSCRRPCQHN